MTERTFDVVVIGAGSAGENAAGRCAEGGLSVAIVEHELVGGLCSYWGCMPSKALLRPGEVLAAVRRVPGAAAAVTGELDVDAALARRDDLAGHWDDEGALPWLTDRGIEIVRGTARLDGERRVAVSRSDGGETARLRAERAVVVATGTRAAIPPIDGIEDAGVWTNREITTAEAVPARLLVLGGGAVGVEMAQAARRLGAGEVTVIESADRLLSGEEPFAGDALRDAFAAEGIDVRTGAEVTSVHRTSGGAVRCTLAGGEELTGDELLVATGRRPATDDLGLETVGLEPGAPIEVDDQLRASGVAGGWLFAVGDCNGRSELTHMGKYQARVAGDVILGRPAAATSDHRAVPRIVFTDPQVCSVGLTEADAREQGISVRSVRHATGAVAGAAIQATEFPGESMLVIDEDARVVVGATFVGPGVQELLHSATIAIVGRVTLDDLWHAVPPFPTVSEVWLRLLEAYGC